MYCTNQYFNLFETGIDNYLIVILDKSLHPGRGDLFAMTMLAYVNLSAPSTIEYADALPLPDRDMPILLDCIPA